MPTITALYADPELPQDSVVETSDGQHLSFDARFLARLRVEVGDDVERLRCLGRLDEATQRAWTRALELLSYRDRTRSKLAERLAEKEPDAARVELVLQRLVALGYLDDARLAERQASAAFGSRARSPRRVEQALRHKGVEGRVAQEAVRAALDAQETTERDLALRAAQKKLPSLARFDAKAQRQKLYGFLSRQGFSGDSVRYALDRSLRGSTGDE